MLFLDESSITNKPTKSSKMFIFIQKIIGSFPHNDLIKLFLKITNKHFYKMPYVI